MIKLLKYELKQTWRMCTTLLGIILLGCLGLMFNPFNKFSIMFPLYIVLFSMVIIGASIFLFFYCMGSFNQEFTQPQGYLIMTLPIRAKDFIWAKFINQGIWIALCTLILMWKFPIIMKRYTGASIYMQVAGMPSLVESFANGISSYFLTVFIIYFSITVLSIQPRNNQQTFTKIILAMGLIYTAGAVISAISIFVPYGIQYGIPTNLAGIEQLIQYIQNNTHRLNMFNIVLNIIFGGIFYIVTKWIIENKVQL